MLQLVNLEKHFRGEYLFRGVNWQIRDTDRIGLCGANGSGKTTLLRILAGEVQPDAGEVSCPKGTTIGYLPQDGLSVGGRTLFDEARQAFAPLLALAAEQEKLEKQLSDVPSDDPGYIAIISRYDEVMTLFRDGEGFAIDGQVAQVLLGLGFTREEFEKDCGQFSGGWQMRIALARLLLARPDVLLLDEPTNHLDMEARDWLRGFLVNYPKSVVLVSHDRYFLDSVVSRITEISALGFLDFSGGYSRFLVLREEYIERAEKHNERIQSEIDRLQENVNRFGAKATKAAQAQSWVKQIDKLRPQLNPLPPPRETIRFRFPSAPRSGKVVLAAEAVGKAYGSLTVLNKADLLIERGDRVALVGVNGAGKSTLMRILAGRESHDGKVTPGHAVKASFFAQDQAHELNMKLTVLQEAESGAPADSAGRLRSMLGSFLFSGDAAHKPCGVLSGGERNRLALLKLLLQPANLLLLDEPTNHLDLDSKDVLLEALQHFEGTIVFVSHDRYFVEQLATKVVEVGGGTVHQYPGTYEEFLWKKRQDGDDPAYDSDAAFASVERPTEAAEKKVDKADRIAAHEARKTAAADERKREKRIVTIEEQIAKLEAKIVQIEADLADPAQYSDSARATELTREHHAAKAKVERFLAEWEGLH